LRKTHRPWGAGPPLGDRIVSGKGVEGADTGPADSVAMDPGFLAATTLGLTNKVSKVGSEVAIEATSFGSTSSSQRAFDLV